MIHHPFSTVKLPLRAPFAMLAAALMACSSVTMAQSTPATPPTPDQIRQAISSELPAPPAGFAWKMYKNTVFLKPSGWNEREINPPGNAFPFGTYATSPETFSETKQIEMGMTVQVFSGTQRLRGLEAKKAAVMFVQLALAKRKKEDVLMLSQIPSGDFERTVFRYRDAPPGLKPVIIHQFILANNVTDSMHVFMFESPEDTWAENWAKFGTPIISRLQVVPLLPIN